MSNEPQPQALVAQPAVLRGTIQITRKATGLVETYEFVGTPVDEPPEQLKEPS